MADVRKSAAIAIKAQQWLSHGGYRSDDKILLLGKRWSINFERTPRQRLLNSSRSKYRCS